MRSIINPWTVISLLLFAALAVEIAHEKEGTAFGTFLSGIMSSELALAQNGDECSEYIGDATINEVHKGQGNYYFVEMKIPVGDAEIEEEIWEDWEIEICSQHDGTDSQSISLDSEDDIDATNAPWIVLTDGSLNKHQKVNLEGMEVVLRDENQDVIDYLLVGDGSTCEYDIDCDFSYDTYMQATDSRSTIARVPDGTGEWTELEEPTRGEPNIPVGEVEEGDFNAVEEGGDAIDGPLYTKIAGKDITLDIISLHPGEGQDTKEFEGEVEIELVDAASGSDCESLDDIAHLGIETFDDEERITAEGLTFANAISAARIKVTESNGGGNPDQGCSQDTFTIRPHHLTLEATDENWETPGTNRTLNSTLDGNCTEANGSDTCHKAGRPFYLQGQARNADNQTVEEYNDVNATFNWQTIYPSDGVNGTLKVLDNELDNDTVEFQDSEFGPTNATYNEVGIINATLNDGGRFADTSGDTYEDNDDSPDCVPGSSSNDQDDDPENKGRYGCQTATDGPETVGRFVPDRFEASYNAPFFDNACEEGGFTYLNQPFYYFEAPEVTLTALNANNEPTRNYAGDFFRFDKEQEDLLENRNYTDQSNAFAYLNATKKDNATVSETEKPDGNFTFEMDAGEEGDEFRFHRNGTEQPFQAYADLVLDEEDLKDQDGICYEVNGNCSNYTIENITGTELRFGRLNLQSAYGSGLLDLELPIRAQYYAGDGFVTNTEDQCTRLTVGNYTEPVQMQLKNEEVDWRYADQETDLAGRDPQGATYGREIKSTDSGTNATLDQGRASLILAAPEEEDSAGYVHVRANLKNHPWLQHDWSGDGNYTDNPNATATFGIFRGNEHIIHQQESTWK